MSDDLATLDISSGDLWESNAQGPLFARLRAEQPVHFCPESFFGPYWSVTRYADVEEVEGNPQVYSSSWEHGGIVRYAGYWRPAPHVHRNG
jgi:cytochrome P450